MLGYYGMSLQGNSHIADGTECQDAHVVKQVGKWVVAAIADGLGSAKHSSVGAKTAVDTVMRFVEENLPERWNEKDLGAALRLAYNAAFRAVKKIAEEQKQDIKEYDTTLTAMIYNGVNVVFGHVGDGGIVTLSKYGDFSILTTAQKGEEHNVTVPLRMGGEYWNFGTSRDPVCALLMMTDGIFDVACPVQLAKRNPPIYVKFVRSFMDVNVLPVKTQKDFDEAQSEIKAFFTGKEIGYITDDKTIVGIINTDEKPEVKPAAYYADPDWEGMKKAEYEGLYGGRASAPPMPPPAVTQPPKPAEQKPAASGVQTTGKPPLRPTPVEPDPKPNSAGTTTPPVPVPPEKPGRSSTGYEKSGQGSSSGRHVDIKASTRRNSVGLVIVCVVLLIGIVVMAVMAVKLLPQNQNKKKTPVESKLIAKNESVIDGKTELDKLESAFGDFKKLFESVKKDDDTIQVKYFVLYEKAVDAYTDGTKTLVSNAGEVGKAVKEIEKITGQLKTAMEKDEKAEAPKTPVPDDSSAAGKSGT
jgi:hypothetical protein